MNENTALEVELEGEKAEPVFCMPNKDGAVVAKLLPNIGDTENALLAPKVELLAGKGSGAVVGREVEPEAAVKGNMELELEGLELKGAEQNGELAKFGKFPMFDFSGGTKLNLLAELCVDNKLLFPDWAHLFPENNADSGEVTLDLPREATETTLPNCGEKLNGVLLLPSLDLSCAANKLAPLNFGEKLEGALPLPDGGASTDWEVVPANICENVDELLGLPPVELHCMLNGAAMIDSALN